MLRPGIAPSIVAAAALFGGVVAIAGPGYSSADEVSAVPQEIVITSATIDAAREGDNPPRELRARKEAELAQELVADATAEGVYLDEDSVDVVPLLDGNVQLAVPVDTATTPE